MGHFSLQKQWKSHSDIWYITIILESILSLRLLNSSIPKMFVITRITTHTGKFRLGTYNTFRTLVCICVLFMHYTLRILQERCIYYQN